MYLNSIKFKLHPDTPAVWHLMDCTFGKINLMVGKNATGKTRTLMIIASLANLVAGDRKLPSDSADYHFSFSDDNETMDYFLVYNQGVVTFEKLIKNGEVYLERGKHGIGKIWAEKLNTFIDFQASQNELACVSRRDSIQHPFFEELYQWGKSLRHYFFGSSFGKDLLAILVKGDKKESFNLKKTNNVVGLFYTGYKKHKNNLLDNIIKDMSKIKYKLKDVYVAPMKNVILEGLPNTIENSAPNGLWVKEKGLKEGINQNEMSQGMFRALSLIIQLNLSEIESQNNFILIDDIGEGLDFERSSLLIKYLIQKAKKTNVQLIMTTNDRFVMNNVPLEYWSVIQRINNKSKIFNYRNSKAIFDDFEYTGLNNFDFLSSDFYKKGFDKK